MKLNVMCRLIKVAALTLAALLFVLAVLNGLPLHVRGEADGAKGNVADRINLTSLIISIDDEVIYDKTRAVATPSVRLAQDSTISFSLRWEVIGDGDEFREGDYFSIPVMYVDNLRLTEPFTQILELDAGNGEKVAVAEGRFTYKGGLLAYEVIFNANAADYRIEGGPAGGYAELRLSSGQTELPMTFADSVTVTVEVDTNPGEVLPELPTYPDTLTTMHKAVFSPDVNGGTVNLLTRYPTMQPGGERKFGLDWRITFFDLISHFQEGGAATENVIIEDIAGEGQEFANFLSFAAGDRDKGFGAVNDEDYEAPFFIEIPIVAVGSNRIYNLYGDDTLHAGSRNGYIGTLIRADQLQEISGSDVEAQVRQRPLSWGIEKLGGGREKLILNLGRLGPGVKRGEGLTADLVKEKDYPYAVLDGVIIKELLDAQRMIEAGGADIQQWKRVRKESFDTILHYWPGYRDKLCGIAGIPAGSETTALENALFAMSYDKMNQSGITTLGYDERRAGGIAGTMRIDSFVLRYRTVLSSVTDSDISNSAKISTGILDREDSARYNHQFYAGIFGAVNVGEIAFIKADEADGHSPGETTEEMISEIRGLAGAEFEVYEASGGPPLRFIRNGSAYELRADGDVTVLCSDAAGAFKIMGLSPAKAYALREIAAPPGYQLPAQQNIVFRVSSSTSKYYILTNKKRNTPQGPDSPGSPGTDRPDTDTPGTDRPDTDTPGTDRPDTDTPGTDRPDTDTPNMLIPPSDVPKTDSPYTDIPPTEIPKLGDSGGVRLAAFLLLVSSALIVVRVFEIFRQGKHVDTRN